MKKIILMAMVAGLAFAGCSNEKALNKAKQAAARYWQDKAYPGKAVDIQVVAAEKTDDGFRVRGLVDGENRVGVFNPESETFSEGYYSLAQERNKRVAELEQEAKYWKERAESLEKENYKLKVKLGVPDDKSSTKSDDKE